MGVTRRAAWLLLALLAAATVVGAVGSWRQGYRVYVVHTGSMEPAYSPGDVVLDGPPGELAPGQVITFRHSRVTADLVTHRVVDLQRGAVHTKGDANATADVWDIAPDQVQGRVLARVPRLGYLLVFFQQPLGVGALMSGTLALVLLWGAFFPDEQGQASVPTRPSSSDPLSPGDVAPAA